jgi:hypothetical protein
MMEWKNVLEIKIVEGKETSEDVSQEIEDNAIANRGIPNVSREGNGDKGRARECSTLLFKCSTSSNEDIAVADGVVADVEMRQVSRDDLAESLGQIRS